MSPPDEATGSQPVPAAPRQGEGGDFLIVDDPHNPKQAQSAVERDNALTWFDQTFYSRLNDKQRGVIVVIMQRLHEKDLTGHLLEQGGWAHLKIPAIAEAKNGD